MFGVYEIFHTNARLYPHKTALVKGEARLSYQTLDRQVAALANALYDLGCREGDRVGFMFRNGPEFVVTFYAVQKLGAVGIPFGFLLQEEELLDDLKRTGCQYFLFDQTYTKLVRESVKQLSQPPVLVYNGAPAPEIWSFAQMLERGKADWQYAVSRAPEALALMLFTSGSTGRSKCVMHTQQNLLMFVTLPMMSDNTFVREDVMLYYAPLFHLAGVTYLLYMLSVGGTMVVVERFDAADILGLLEKERVTQFFLIPPTLVNRLEDVPECRQKDLSSVRYVIASGGGNTPELGRKIYALFPRAVLCNTYGHSERAANTILFLSREKFAENPELLTSVGKATQFSEFRLVDGTGRDSSCGEAYARSPGMLAGYWETEPPFVDGWFPTGDILRRDEEGYYFFLDRKKDMIKTGGENVYAAEVENVIRLIPAVSACAVVGMPDEVYGSAVTAVVVLRPGASLTEEEVVCHCRQHLASYKKPRRVYFVESLPVSAVGKVQKALLRQRLLER